MKEQPRIVMINCRKCGKLEPGERAQESIQGVVLSGTTWICLGCWDTQVAYLIDREEEGKDPYLGVITAWGPGTMIPKDQGRIRVAMGEKGNKILDYGTQGEWPFRTANWKYGTQLLKMCNQREKSQGDHRAEPEVMIKDLEKWWPKEDLAALEQHPSFRPIDKTGGRWHLSTMERYPPKWRLLDRNLGSIVTEKGWVEEMRKDQFYPRHRPEVKKWELTEEDRLLQRKAGRVPKEEVSERKSVSESMERVQE